MKHARDRQRKRAPSWRLDDVTLPRHSDEEQRRGYGIGHDREREGDEDGLFHERRAMADS